MRRDHNRAVAAAGLAAPESATSETARGANAGRIEEQGTTDSGDCAAKSISTVAARAALLGIELHPIGTDAWLLRHARGAEIGIVRGASGLAGALAAFEAARNDARELIQRVRGAR